MTMTTPTLSVPSPPDLVFELAMPGGFAEVIADDIDRVEITLSTDAPADSLAARVIADAALTTHNSVVYLHVPDSGHDTVTVISRHTVVTGTVTGIDIDEAGTVVIGDGAVNTGHGEVRATIRLPHRSDLRVETLSTNVRTRGPLGTVDFDSVSGDLGADMVRTLNANTTSGAVRAWGVDGASVRTVSGAIRIGRTSVAVLRSASGNVQIDDFGGSARLTTVSGNITVAGVRPGRLSASSTSGDITVTSTPDLAALGEGALIVEARSVTGDVRIPRLGYATAR